MFSLLFDVHVVVLLPGMHAESVAVRQIAVPKIPDTERNSEALFGERRWNVRCETLESASKESVQSKAGDRGHDTPGSEGK